MPLCLGRRTPGARTWPRRTCCSTGSPCFPWLTSPDGQLGPYFNLLPIVTILLYLVQNKMLMPPAQNEQQAIQQKTHEHHDGGDGLHVLQGWPAVCACTSSPRPSGACWSGSSSPSSPPLPSAATDAGGSGGSTATGRGPRSQAIVSGPSGAAAAPMPTDKDKRDRGNRRKQKGRK